MAYTTIDDPSEYFTITLYAGNGSDDRSITNSANAGNFKPDWVWGKNRSQAGRHTWSDSSRGATKNIFSERTDAESTEADVLQAFETNGFQVGTDTRLNSNGDNFVAWQWKAGGTAPTKTYKVVVVDDSGNKYRFRNSGDTATFAQSAVTLDLQEGGTYIFDQSDSSNSGHPLRFYTASDKSGGEYTTGVTTSGTAGNAGAFTQITVAASAPTLYYQCSSHAGMGGQVNTNTTHGQTNFDGSILSVSQANTTAGFSIVLFTGNATAGQTVGHGLGVKPEIIFAKNRSNGNNWNVYAEPVDNTGNNYLSLNGTVAKESDFNMWNDTAPTTSLITLGDRNETNGSSHNMVFYCLHSIKGYSKIGFYTGNGSSSNAPFVYLGFKPAFFLIKSIDAARNWHIIDDKRNTINPLNLYLNPNNSDADGTFEFGDFLSNGFKITNLGNTFNTNGEKYLYYAVASSPFVSSKGVPTTAR